MSKSVKYSKHTALNLMTPGIVLEDIPQNKEMVSFKKEITFMCLVSSNKDKLVDAFLSKSMVKPEPKDG